MNQQTNRAEQLWHNWEAMHKQLRELPGLGDEATLAIKRQQYDFLRQGLYRLSAEPRENEALHPRRKTVAHQHETPSLSSDEIFGTLRKPLVVEFPSGRFQLSNSPVKNTIVGRGSHLICQLYGKRGNLGGGATQTMIRHSTRRSAGAEIACVIAARIVLPRRLRRARLVRHARLAKCGTG